MKRNNKLDVAGAALAGVLALAFASYAGCATASCTPASTAISDAGPTVEAGIAITGGLCSLIEGIDTNGTVRTICATVEEVLQVVAFILTLRSTNTDAGIAKAEVCKNVGGICATDSERAKGILFITQLRTAKLTRDAGK